MSIGSRLAHTAEQVYYVLGIAYYLKAWLAILGITAATVGVLMHRANLWRGLTVALGVCLLATATLLWLATRHRRLAGVNPLLAIVEFAEAYHILGSNRYRSERDVTVRALHAGAQHYTDKFYWTGIGNVTPALLEPRDGSVAIEPERTGPGNLCRVTFPRGLRRRERCRVHYQLNLIDTTGAARPYFSMTFGEPVEAKVRLSVVFTTSVPHRFTKQIFSGPYAEVPISEESEEIPRGVDKASWEIHRPRPNHVYKIVWSDTESPQRNAAPA